MQFFLVPYSFFVFVLLEESVVQEQALQHCREGSQAPPLTQAPQFSSAAGCPLVKALRANVWGRGQDSLEAWAVGASSQRKHFVYLSKGECIRLRFENRDEETEERDEGQFTGKERKGKEKSLSRVQLFATPWTLAYPAPPSVGFSRPGYWSGFPSRGHLPNSGIEPRSPTMPADVLPSEPPGKQESSSNERTSM